MTVFVMQLQSNLKSIEELISQSRWSYKKPRTVNYRYNQQINSCTDWEIF